ncbi:MAG: CobW family GTP-binding protein [Candidatus Dormibacteraceae bacterium]
MEGGSLNGDRSQTFAAPAVMSRLRLDAVITVVDAENFDLWLDSQPVAAEQILCADLLVLNKTDLIDSAAVETVSARLLALNPDATVLPSTRGRLPIELLLDVQRRPEGMGEYADLPHRHDADLGAVSYSGDGRMDFAALQRFLESLPEGVLRAKGIVAVEGLDRELVFHRVGRRNFLDQGRTWSGPELSRAVFIGSGFDAGAVLAGIRACRLGPLPAPGEG